jgi:hypothetical protein
MYLVRNSRGLGGIVQDIAAAITRQENVAASYNNPGGLIAAPGCTSRPGQIAICPDLATGQAGLERQVQLDIGRGMTLSELINSWAPKCSLPICKGNDPATYAAHVSDWTGLDLNTPLASMADSGSVSAPASASGSWDVPATIDLSGLDFSGGSMLPIALGIGLLAVVLLLAHR